MGDGATIIGYQAARNNVQVGTAVRVAAATRIQSVVRMMLGQLEFGNVLRFWLLLSKGLSIPHAIRCRLPPANAGHLTYGHAGHVTYATSNMYNVR